MLDLALTTGFIFTIAFIVWPVEPESLYEHVTISQRVLIKALAGLCAVVAFFMFFGVTHLISWVING